MGGLLLRSIILIWVGVGPTNSERGNGKILQITEPFALPPLTPRSY